MADDTEEELTRGRGSDPTNVLVFLLFAAALVLMTLDAATGAPEGPSVDPAGSQTNTKVTGAVYLAAIGIAVLFVRGAARPRRYRKPRRALCTHCLHPTLDGVHFCPRCSAPQTVFAATGPYERVFAQMWILGKAAHQPTRRLHVLGLALVAFPPILGLLVAMFQFLDFYADPDPWGAPWTGTDVWAWVLYGASSLVTVAIYALLLRYAWRNWRRRVRDPAAAPPASAYGHPPWWTYDIQGDLPDPGEDDGGDDTPPPIEPEGSSAEPA